MGLQVARLRASSPTRAGVIFKNGDAYELIGHARERKCGKESITLLELRRKDIQRAFLGFIRV